MSRIYLDTNVLVAYYAADEAEKDKKALVLQALSVFDRLGDVELCTSMWTVTEMMNTLVKAKKMDGRKVAEIANELLRRKRLQNQKVSFVQVSPQQNYNFDDFFVDVGEAILSHPSHLADAIHGVIVKKNNITQVLTFDEQESMKGIPGVRALHPRDINVQAQPT